MKYNRKRALARIIRKHGFTADIFRADLPDNHEDVLEELNGTLQAIIGKWCDEDIMNVLNGYDDLEDIKNVVWDDHVFKMRDAEEED